MTEPLFNVIAEGRTAAGFETVAVAQQLIAQLRLSEAQAQRLLDGRPAIAKRGVAHAVATAYCARLGALGLQVRIEPLADPGQSSEPSASQPSPQQLSQRSLSQSRADDPTDWPQLADFLHGVPRPLPRIRCARFRLALTSATAKLIFITALYAGLLALGIAALATYTISFIYLLAAPPLLFSIPVFLIPWLALLALNILLLRPLLPLRQRAESYTCLHAHQQPQLFHWLAQSCELAGVRVPREVALCARVEHAAQPVDERGALWRGDYRLSLSLPLLETASLRDNSALLAGLLATEATPFALRLRHALQAAAARCSVCIEGRDWLAAHGRDIAVAGRFTAALFALHNRLLAPFAAQLDRLQQSLARQTLLEADRLYATLAGSARTVERLLLQYKLDQAGRDAAALNGSSSDLAADLPALIQHYYAHFNSDNEAQLRKQWGEVVRRTPADALPSAAERIEATQTLEESGALPAIADIVLLAGRDALARQATIAEYALAGLAFDPDRLRPTEALTFAVAEDLLQREQTALYFNRWFRPFRFWRMADYALIRDMPIGDAVQQLNVCVSEIRRLTPDRTRQLHEYERLQNQLQELLVGQHVLAQRQPFQFRHTNHDGASLQPLIAACQQQLAKVTEQLTTQETIMGGRISLALRLSGQSRDAEQLHRALQLTGNLKSRLYKLALDTYQLEQLTQRHYRQREPHYGAAIGKLEEKIDGAILLLRERLKEIPHPFDARYATLGEQVAALLQAAETQPAAGRAEPATQVRAQCVLRTLYAFNEQLSRQAAHLGTIAEEAYSIEAIRKVAKS